MLDSHSTEDAKESDKEPKYKNDIEYADAEERRRDDVLGNWAGLVFGCACLDWLVARFHCRHWKINQYLSMLPDTMSAPFPAHTPRLSFVPNMEMLSQGWKLTDNRCKQLKVAVIEAQELSTWVQHNGTTVYHINQRG